jgi:predicted metal-dependent hydrolase
MDLNIYGYILSILIVIVIVKYYFDSDLANLNCITSSVDGNKYCVRQRLQQEMAADLLATVTQSMKKLVDYMQRNYPTYENVQRLVKNFNPKKIIENDPEDEHTAYSENKGEKIAFCLTKSKTDEKLIDKNTLTFVAIHELAHTMTLSIGHKEEFWNNFKFLLENAVRAHIYTSVDYAKTPIQYCGILIDENPLYKK